MAEAVNDTIERTFEPTRYLTKLGPADYLEVKWRLVWFRHDNPNGTIDTDPIEIGTDRAVFKATIVSEGGGRATGIGSETKADFRDFVEKAETKAIGRALAALGYGTQFANDFEDGATVGRPVDAPVQRNAPSGPEPLATPKQVDFAKSLLVNKGITDQQANDYLEKRFPGGLKRSQATPLINELKSDSFVVEAPVAAPVAKKANGAVTSTEFWAKARELGYPTKAKVSEYLGYDISDISDFGVLMKSLNEKSTSEELEVPY